jgi:hypothetical protein
MSIWSQPSLADPVIWFGQSYVPVSAPFPLLYYQCVTETNSPNKLNELRTTALSFLEQIAALFGQDDNGNAIFTFKELPPPEGDISSIQAMVNTQINAPFDPPMLIVFHHSGPLSSSIKKKLKKYTNRIDQDQVDVPHLYMDTAIPSSKTLTEDLINHMNELTIDQNKMATRSDDVEAPRPGQSIRRTDLLQHWLVSLGTLLFDLNVKPKNSFDMPKLFYVHVRIDQKDIWFGRYYQTMARAIQAMYPN